MSRGRDCRSPSEPPRLAETLGPVQPVEAVHLVEGIHDPQARAMTLWSVSLEIPKEDHAAVQLMQEDARHLLQIRDAELPDSVTRSMRYSLLCVLAQSQPEEALTMAEHTGPGQKPLELPSLPDRRHCGEIEPGLGAFPSGLAT